MGVLSAGIRSLLRKTEGADLSRPAEAPDPGRDHPGMVGDIISERWARSSRNRWAASSRNDGRLPPESAGLTKQVIRSRLRFGWKATGKGGYYGYAWRHDN